jgi:hypothetical protein
MDIWTSTGLTKFFSKELKMAKSAGRRKKSRASRKSLGREGSPHGGNGLRGGIARVIRQLQAHKQGKNTKLFTETGSFRLTNKAGGVESADYWLKLAKRDKREKEKNAKSNSTK